ncbi:hypothetical protein ACFYKX_11195 [Cytobacillus sp. FJAT-54145]|uniref:Lipoprotein n=1 Tax=Cytobacillus spartinae TaxID=3299023 RepID=A0ABW6KE45_9BACI
MKKTPIVLAGIATALLLTACGTNVEVEEVKDGTNGSGVVKEVKVDPPVKSPEKPTNGDELMFIPEQNLTYTVNGKTVEETAFRIGNSDLGLYVLPEYQLEQEEPGKSIIIHGKTGDMMRMEKAPKTTTEDMLAELKTRAEAVSKDVFHNETAGTDLDGAIHYKAYHGEEVVNFIYLPEQQAMLTIFDQKSAESIEPLVAMAKTIHWNEFQE